MCFLCPVVLSQKKKKKNNEKKTHVCNCGQMVTRCRSLGLHAFRGASFAPIRLSWSQLPSAEFHSLSLSKRQSQTGGPLSQSALFFRHVLIFLSSRPVTTVPLDWPVEKKKRKKKSRAQAGELIEHISFGLVRRPTQPSRLSRAGRFLLHAFGEIAPGCPRLALSSLRRETCQKPRRPRLLLT